MKFSRFFSILALLTIVTGCASIEKLDIQEEGFKIPESISEIRAIGPGVSISLIRGIVDKKILLLPEGEQRLFFSLQSNNGIASGSRIYNFDGVSKYEVEVEERKSESWKNQAVFTIKNIDTNELLSWKR